MPNVYALTVDCYNNFLCFQVDGPDSVAKCTLEQQENGKFLVVYTPQEVGVFDIRVMWNGQEVPGKRPSFNYFDRSNF